MASPQQGIEDLKRIKSLGFRGAMLPGYPAMEDYHSKMYDPLWQAAVDLDMPLSFHVLTYKNSFGEVRGPTINNFISIIRGNQDIIGTLIFGGVFERFPLLKVVCVEADAGWVPHFMYRMDHALKRASAKWREEIKLSRKPREYFYDSIYVTFQDDVVAFQMRALFNPKRLMWANDFPHSDSTWPGSQKLLAEHTKDLTQEEKDAVLHDNVAELYKLRAPRLM